MQTERKLYDIRASSVGDKSKIMLKVSDKLGTVSQICITVMGSLTYRKEYFMLLAKELKKCWIVRKYCKYGTFIFPLLKKQD